MNRLKKIKKYISTLVNRSPHVKNFLIFVVHVLGFIIFVETAAIVFAYLGFFGEVATKSLFFLWKELGFLVLPTTIVLLSGLVVLNTNPIYSLASLILVFFSAALFLLSIKITFLAMIYLIIYIGAIAILFLFVIMMFNLRNLKQGPGVTKVILSYNFIFYCFIAWEFYTILCNSVKHFVEYNNYFFWKKENSLFDLTYDLTYQHLDILLFGTLLYTHYSGLFILSALILLTAMLGAIVLALSTSNFNFKNARKKNEITEENKKLYI